MTEQHTSAEDYETKSVRDLRNLVTREDETKAARAVEKLLSLGHFAPQAEPKYDSALTREMMKSAGS